MQKKQRIKRIVSAVLFMALLCSCLFAAGESELKILNFAVIADSVTVEGCMNGTSVLDSYFAIAKKYDVRPVIFIKADGMEYNADLVFALSKLRVQGYEIYCAAESPQAAYEFRDFVRHTAKHGITFLLTSNTGAEFEGFETVYCKSTVRFYEELVSSLYSGDGCCTGLLLSQSSLYAAELILGNCRAGGSVPADIYSLVKINRNGRD